jgi:two-component system sensor histidine kinase QseC
VAQRSPNQLDPVDIGTVPAEIRPLAAALNRLFECLNKAFAKERRFTSDAAHEMRTPLSVIKTHAQIAARAVHPAEKDRAIRYVIEGVDRSSHLVLQMLTLARLDPDNPSLHSSLCALVDIAKRVQHDLHPMADDKGIRLALTADPETHVIGYEPGLAILLRNLVDNAIRYTPVGGQVFIQIREEAEHCLLNVLDTGPGIAQEELERIFERFYRPAGQRQPGAGLGLSIVSEICQLHQASITLGTGAGDQGLSVSIRFRRATEPASDRPSLHSVEMLRERSAADPQNLC